MRYGTSFGNARSDVPCKKKTERNLPDCDQHYARHGRFPDCNPLRKEPGDRGKEDCPAERPCADKHFRLNAYDIIAKYTAGKKNWQQIKYDFHQKSDPNPLPLQLIRLCWSIGHDDSSWGDKKRQRPYILLMYYFRID